MHVVLSVHVCTYLHVCMSVCDMHVCVCMCECM